MGAASVSTFVLFGLVVRWGQWQTWSLALSITCTLNCTVERVGSLSLAFTQLLGWPYTLHSCLC